MRNFQVLIITSLCFESESYSETGHFVAEKLDFDLLCTNPMGFFQFSALLLRRLVGKCSKQISRRWSPTKQMGLVCLTGFFFTLLIVVEKLAAKERNLWCEIEFTHFRIVGEWC